MFDGFETRRLEGDGAAVHLRVGGSGPAALLLHGYPQSHVMWHKLAPTLAEHFTVVAPDLRGYGDSGKPPSAADHEPYSKRASARDLVAAMNELGFDRFALVGHDRGARVGRRLTLDNPARVSCFASLDVVPTAEIFRQFDRHVAQAYFHWLLMLQPEPLAETVFGRDPEYWIRWLIGRWCTTEGAITEPAMAEYIRCFSDPATIHTTCEDYRAIDLDIAHDSEDKDKRITCPVLALWGERQGQGEGWPSVRLDMLASWRASADHVEGGPIPCGHFMPEEAPHECLDAMLPFLREHGS